MPCVEILRFPPDDTSSEKSITGTKARANGGTWKFCTHCATPPLSCAFWFGYVNVAGLSASPPPGSGPSVACSSGKLLAVAGTCGVADDVSTNALTWRYEPDTCNSKPRRGQST